MSAPKIVVPLREVFSCTDPIAYQWLEELSKGPTSLESLPGVVLLALGLAERLNHLTHEERAPIKVYAQALFPCPPDLTTHPPYSLHTRESPTEAAILWTRHWLILCMEKAYGLVLVEAIDTEHFITSFRHALSLYAYAWKRYGIACGSMQDSMTIEWALACMLFQALTTLSKRLDQSVEDAARRPGSYYMLWKLIDWCMQTHPLFLTSPMAQGLQKKFPALYYETLAKEFEKKGVLSNALWAYQQACAYDTEGRYRQATQAIEKRLKNASIRVSSGLATSTQEEPDLAVRQKAPVITLKPHLVNVSTAMEEYLWTKDLLFSLKGEWLGQEFASLQSAPSTYTSMRNFRYDIPKPDPPADPQTLDQDELDELDSEDEDLP